MKNAREIKVAAAQNIKEKTYWINKLSGEPERSSFPGNRREAGPLTRGFGTLTVEYDHRLFSRLVQLSKGNDHALHVILLTVLTALLGRYTRLDEITVGTPIYRQQTGGDFINTVLPVRTRLTPGITFKELLVRVRASLLEAVEHQAFPVVLLPELLNLPIPGDGFPLFDVALLLENIHDKRYLEHLDLNVIFRFSRTETALEAVVEYSPGVYRQSTAERIAAHFKRLLEGALAGLDQPVSGIDILFEEEKSQLLLGFNDTAIDYPSGKTVHRLFEEQAARTPDAVAVYGSYRTYKTYMTYSELNRRADRLAAFLWDQGVRPETVVGIMMERSIEMIVGTLGILKAGGAYMAIDPGYPEERKQYMLADSGASLLLTARDINECREQACLFRTRTNGLCYIIYTSGSTGRPKGVMVEHRNVVRLVKNTNFISFSETLKILQTGALEFDASTFEIWGALLNGGSLFLADKERILDHRELKALINKHRVTTMWLTASLFNRMVDADVGIFHGLRHLLVGGEALSPVHINRVRVRFPGLEIINGYGPTENTTFSTTFSIDGDYSQNIPIGRPIANSTAYILDRNGGLVPVGVPGELVVGGDGVSRGYLNDPELTNKKFSGGPGGGFSKEPPGGRRQRYYKTGDLARWLSGGSIEFLGRIDQQVKLRGFRIELGEIETQLLRHPGIREAVAVIRGEESGDKYLCAYIVPVGTEPVSGLDQFLSRTLPGYMVPSYFVSLERIPLTANGKVDRRALPEPETRSAGVYVAPRDAVEEKLSEIWADVLDIHHRRDALHESPGGDQDVRNDSLGRDACNASLRGGERPGGIGIDDDFFRLGGHSLKAANLLSRIHEAFDVPLTVPDLFAMPVIRQLSSYITEAVRKKYVPIENVEEKEYYPLSAAQERLYVLNRMKLDGTGYNLAALYLLENAPDFPRLRGAFEALIERHESFRTSFHMVDEQPVQRIHKTVPFDLVFHDPGSDRPVEAFIAERIRPFDLSEAPLFRAELIKTGENRYILLIDVHHIIVDGLSMEIAKGELAALYESRELPPLRVRYRDCCQWQWNERSSGKMSAHEAYWLGIFGDEIPVSDLPADFPRPSQQVFDGDTFNFRLGEGEAAALGDLSGREGVTLYMLLLAVTTVLVAKISGREDIVIGSPASGRGHVDMGPVIGMFVNTLAMRTRPRAHKPFVEFLREVKAVTLAAFENQDYQFEELVEKVAANRDVSRNPLFDIMFAFEDLGVEGLPDGELTLLPFEYRYDQSKFDLTVFARKSEGGELFFTMEYSTRLFKEETVRRFAGYFKRLISQIIAVPGRKLREIELISPGEKEEILYAFNDTATDYPSGKSIHRLFEEQAARTPDAVAVYGSYRTYKTYMTYSELNRRADRLAAFLWDQGVRPETVVGIMMERSVEMIVGILGILKAGGAYMAIDPGYPEERKQYMLADSGAPLLLTAWDINECREQACLFRTRTNGLCYIIYTSGSTGRPKGVMVEHRNVVRLVKNTNFISFSETLKILQTGALEFDASTFEIWGALLNGGSLFLAEKERILNHRELKALINKHRVTTMWLTASLFNRMVDADVGIFHGLRHLLVGGEALSPVHINRVRVRFPGLEIINGYGPTENTTFSTTFSIDGDYSQNIPIGRPIANSTAYILDRNGGLVPVGVPGELVVGGDGVSRGYLNDPELTNKKFSGGPGGGFSKEPPGGRRHKYYKTGDLARWLSGGSIEFLGRIDQQVKLRGFRIELGEIETQLLRHPGIREAVAVIRGEESGDKYLCAYIVPVGTGPVSGLDQFLSRTLPGYMVPSYFVPLERIPLTANGKVDRRALPEPETRSTGAYVAPRDAVEEKLAGIWADVLDIPLETVGIDDNFFQLGGHSLKATILLARIHKEFDVPLTVSDIFVMPVISELSVYIKKAVKEKYAPIESVEEKEYYPLSSAQERLYVLNRMKVDDTGYNLYTMHVLETAPDIPRLQSAFEALIRRHESFRTSFHMLEDRPVQRIHGTVPFEIVSYDLSAGNSVEEIIRGFIRPFDLSAAPLFRAALIESGDNRNILVMDMHHIVADGLSQEILNRELALLYESKPLPPLPLQYKDCSEWQRKERERERLRDQESYWLNIFEEEVPVLNLPLDFPRPSRQGFEGDTVYFDANHGESAALEDMASREGVTLFMLLSAIYTVLLSKLSGQEDIVVGTPASGRHHVDMEPVIGMFVNTLALRTRPVGKKPFRDYLREVRAFALGAFENQEYQFEELVEKVAMDRDISRNPIFDTMFVPGDTGTAAASDRELVLLPFEYRYDQSKFDLSLHAGETDGILSFAVIYSTRLFKEATILRFTRYFKRLVSEIVAAPGQKLREFELISPEEKREILFDFNDTAADYPRNKTIHRLFEEQVERTPDAVAVYGAYRTHMTYSELNRRAGQLAAFLWDQGVRPETVVGIMMERSIEMIVGTLGILKTGGAYMAIDPGYPEERKQYMLADSGASLLLTARDINECREQACLFRTRTNGLCYIIYTSGSTGRPKGVMVEHRNVVRLVKNTNFISFSETLKILQTGALEFDASTFEIWGALLNGGSLYLADKERILDHRELKNLINKHRITTMWLTASLFNRMVDADVGIFHGLRHLLVGGEALSPVHINRVRVRFPGLEIINGYGPTENTTFSTTFSIDGDYSQHIPIGRPIANSTAYIFDRNGGLVPVGVPGELVVGGDGVSRGYLNDPELTNKKFSGGPGGGFLKEPPGGRRQKYYKTGDLARWLSDGSIEFLGRIDQQVKLRGFRIELGEIESRLVLHPGIREAVVVIRGEESGDKYLCAYIVPAGTGPVSGLDQFLSHTLPGYMVPSYFVSLERIPLTANGKVDRRALPEPETRSTGAYVAPRDAVEKKLAEIWADVLGIPLETVGIGDNFFQLGGHSLKATILLARIHKEFDVPLTVSDIFVMPVIRELSACIKKTVKEKYTPIESVEEKEYYPLSSAQERLYVLNRMKVDDTGYNLYTMHVLETAPDIPRLQSAFEALIRRHESFRTSFHMLEDQPVQRIHGTVPFETVSYDLSAGNSVEEIIRGFIRPFDLSAAPLFRAALIESGDNRNILVMDMHHIIADGLSQEILNRELALLYESKPLPPLTLQYRDCSEWQRSERGKEKIRAQETYWLGVFEGEIPVLNLPLDFPRPSRQGYEGDTVYFDLNHGEAAALEDMASREGVTLFMLLSAMYTVLLSKLSGQEDIVVGSPASGRHHVDMEPVIGMFVNTLALRSHPMETKPFTAYLAEVRTLTLGAFENQEYQFEELVENVAVDRDFSRNPLFDTMFVLGDPEALAAPERELTLLPCEYRYDQSKFDLSLHAGQGNGAVSFAVTYSTRLFKEATILRFTRYFKRLVSEIVAAPGQKLREFELISPEEKREILFDFNDTAADYPRNKTIHRLFEEQVERTPDAVAVYGAYRTHMTYSELNRRAGQLASLLWEKGVRPDTPVGIMVERSIEMIVGILGILKAGGAYLPMDPGYPEERKRYMLADSCAALLLTAQEIDGCRKQASLFPDLADRDTKSSGNLAYIIYTSGSTGKPKGTMIEHRSLVNRLNWMQKKYPIGPDDILLQKTVYTFDVSVWELLWWAITGAGVCLPVPGAEKDPGIIIDTVVKHRVTVVHFVPSMLAVFLGYLKENRDMGITRLASLKQVFASGEALPASLVKQFNEELSGTNATHLANLYGPTEATIDVTYFNCPFGKNPDGIPIGKPIDNTRMLILDKAGHLQPVGIPGELCIAGTGLARGYLNKPELTAERFNRSYNFFKSSILYKTGDLARWMPYGNIEFLGRIDHQVKIRGFRIELGEIETRLLSHPGVKEAVVVPRGEKSGDNYLCAYVVPEGTDPVPDLEQFLLQTLPGYMIPAHFVSLENFPLTANGKVDRKALPEPLSAASDSHTPPRTAAEKTLARLWSDILGVSVEAIGVDSHFFRLGGHSLKAVKLAAGILKRFKVHVPIHEIFNRPTVGQLAGYIEAAGQETAGGVEPAEKKEYYPISSMQKRLYILDLLDNLKTAYNLGNAFFIEGEPDPLRFQEIFQQLIRRHESLRTSFAIIDDQPVQIVHENVDFHMDCFEAAEDEIRRIVKEFITPFDLGRAPLLRARLVKLPEKRYLFLYDMHHIVSDGVSLNLFIRDFSLLYEGKGDRLPELPIQYKDFSQWRNNPRGDARADFKKKENYWLDRFKGEIPKLEIFTDYPRPPIQSFQGERFRFYFEEDLCERIHQFVKETDTTLYMFLLAIYTVLLSKYTGQADIVVGTPTAGREQVEFENTVGLFINSLPMRNFPRGDRTFLAFLEEVKTTTIDAYENQAYPFGDLMEKVAVIEDLSRSPIFEAELLVQNMDAVQWEIEGLTFTPYDEYAADVTQTDIALGAMESGGRILFDLSYSTALFKRTTMEHFVKYFGELASGVLDNPGIKLGEIEIVPNLRSTRSGIYRESQTDFDF